MAQRTRLLEISLHDIPIGEIEVRGGLNRFFFYDSYLDDPGRRVLGMRFEENVRGQWTGQNALPHWFGNLLPEGSLHRIIDEELRRELGRDPDEVDLLSRLGSDLPGAVTVRSIESSGARTRHPFIERDPLVNTHRTDASAGMRFSVAGVGMKFSLLRSADKFVSPATGKLGDWIVKLPDPVFTQLPGNEFATMSLAKRIGLNVPPIHLVGPETLPGIPEWLWHGERFAFAIERFDRDGADRVHIEDLAQVRGYPVGQRYRGAFESIAAAVWRRTHDADLIEFTRRLAFNFLVGNDDAHLKNWSMIYRDGRTATLSPAYDLVSVEAYTGVGLERSTGLTIANSRTYRDLTLRAFTRMGERLGFQGGDLGAEARIIVDGVKAEWSRYLTELPSEVDRRRVDAHFQRIAAQLGG